MTKKQVVIDALQFRRPAYVPWSWGPTVQCAERLRAHLGTDDLSEFLEPHFHDHGPDIQPAEHIDENHFRDIYGVVWDITVDKDIGTPCEYPIASPSDLDRYEWPDSANEAWYAGLEASLEAHRDMFCRYNLGFSLFERAWTMRGMENLLIDMVERPEFVEEFMDQIVEYNMAQIRHALAAGVDGVHFGDDYGAQRGLIMGITHWRRFIKPRLARMFAPIRAAGKHIGMHSCGCVAELFDELVEIGLKLFNPFQPEVMDVYGLIKQYRGRLAFHGGMSIQKVLPFGSPDDVRRETQRLIDAGRDGGYVFSPSHGVPRDVPPENLVAMMEVLRAQPGYAG